MKGRLFLIPSTIGDSPVESVLPSTALQLLNTINHYIVENVRTARRFLIKAGIKTPIDDLTFYLLNKHTTGSEISGFLAPAKNNQDVAILSEAGAPAVADPGSIIVKMAHEEGIKVVPITGPSSILLALMASGMNGQSFRFQGYLPINSNERIKVLRKLELESKNENCTQIFIEAPYRNQKLLEDITRACGKSTLLCIAVNITRDDEFIKTMPLSSWQKNLPAINKKPAIFLIHASR